jgi:hypothetical protein
MVPVDGRFMERAPRNYYAHCAHEPCDKVVKNSQFSQDVLKQHVTIFELERFMGRENRRQLQRHPMVPADG